MKIGILTAGHAPEELVPTYGPYPHHFAQLLQGHGFEFDDWPVVDGDFPDSPHVCDGWLITGSKHGAYDPLDWIPPLEDFIRATVAANVPLVGICFGHQIIAQALGGKVDKWAGGWAVGRQTYAWNGDDVSLNAWHQDQVVTLPDGARRVASSAFCENAALVYGKQAFTIQAHPEFENDFVSDLSDARGRGVVPDDLLDGAAKHYHTPIDNKRIASEIAQFFRQGSVT